MPLSTFTQDMGERESSFGLVRHVKVRTENYAPLSWREVWEAFAAAYPDEWAVQMFPPASELIDEANVYHLFVLPAPPVGLSIRRPR